MRGDRLCLLWRRRRLRRFWRWGRRCRLRLLRGLGLGWRLSGSGRLLATAAARAAALALIAIALRRRLGRRRGRRLRLLHVSWGLGRRSTVVAALATAAALAIALLARLLRRCERGCVRRTLVGGALAATAPAALFALLAWRGSRRWRRLLSLRWGWRLLLGRRGRRRAAAGIRFRCLRELESLEGMRTVGRQRR